MIADIKRGSDIIKERLDSLIQAHNLSEKSAQVDELEKQMGDPDFWNDQEVATKVSREVSQLKGEIELFEKLSNSKEDLDTMIELAEEDSDEAYEHEAQELLDKLIKDYDRAELTSLLSDEHDIRNAIVSIHPGAGGVDSQDWADMMMRMYIRWAERRGFTAQILGLLPGQEAGIKSVTLKIDGAYAFGYLKSEVGVHRLVRISPFDTAHRRHTSFASVDAFPEMDDDVEVEIEEKYLQIDTYRSSGAGGQHVNVTDSAVRLTYKHPDIEKPVVVQCQNERSQHMNKASAMKVLTSKLYELQLEKKRAEEAELKGEKMEIGWGSQIRSYVMQPYQLVKDMRSGHENGNIQAVLDGDLDDFIHSFLKFKRSGK